MHSLTKMAAVNYFPSIHDKVAETKDTWHRFDLKPKQLSFQRTTAAAAAAEAFGKARAQSVHRRTRSEDPPQQLQAPAASTATTWGCLVLPDYQPLDAFSAPAAEDLGSVSQSEEDEMCELLIRMKELELCGIMGETPVISQCKR